MHSFFFMFCIFYIIFKILDFFSICGSGLKPLIVIESTKVNSTNYSCRVNALILTAFILLFM